MGFGLLSHRQRERSKFVLFCSILPLENIILSGVINTAMHLCRFFLFLVFQMHDTPFNTTFEFCEMP